MHMEMTPDILAFARDAYSSGLFRREVAANVAVRFGVFPREWDEAETKYSRKITRLGKTIASP